MIPASQSQLTLPHTRRCPFYGMHAIRGARMLMGSGGNQCAVIANAYAPCRMERDGKEPIFEDCELEGSGAAEAISGFARFEFPGRQ